MLIKRQYDLYHMCNIFVEGVYKCLNTFVNQCITFGEWTFIDLYHCRISLVFVKVIAISYGNTVVQANYSRSGLRTENNLSAAAYWKWRDLEFRMKDRMAKAESFGDC